MKTNTQKTILTRFGIFLLAMLVGMATSAIVASGQEAGDPKMRAFMKQDESNFFIIMEMDAGSENEARVMYEFLSEDAMIEDEFEVTIIQSEEPSAREVRSIG